MAARKWLTHVVVAAFLTAAALNGCGGGGGGGGSTSSTSGGSTSTSSSTSGGSTSTSSSTSGGSTSTSSSTSGGSTSTSSSTSSGGTLQTVDISGRVIWPSGIGSVSSVQIVQRVLVPGLGFSSQIWRSGTYDSVAGTYRLASVVMSGPVVVEAQGTVASSSVTLRAVVLPPAGIQGLGRQTRPQVTADLGAVAALVAEAVGSLVQQGMEPSAVTDTMIGYMEQAASGFTDTVDFTDAQDVAQAVRGVLEDTANGTTFQPHPPAIDSAAVSPTMLRFTGGRVTVTATVTDSRSDVTSVIASITPPGAAPTSVPMAAGAGGVYTASWTAPANLGTATVIYTVQVRAEDSVGHVTQSDALSFSVESTQAPPPPPARHPRAR